jgi:hypothetical protein
MSNKQENTLALNSLTFANCLSALAYCQLFSHHPVLVLRLYEESNCSDEPGVP